MIESIAITLGRRFRIRLIYRLDHLPQCEYPLSLSLHIRRFSSSSSITDDEGKSFTVCFLVNKCGISSKEALVTSKYVSFKTVETPNSVLSFFKRHGFSASQISKVVKLQPRVLLSQPIKTLSPKLQFLRSLGFSSSDVAQILSVCPRIFHSSLENQLVPCFEFVEEYYGSKDAAVAAVKRCPRMLLSSFHRHTTQVLETLRDAGIPENCITMFVHQQLKNRWKQEKLRRIVADVFAMGIDPTKTAFVAAVTLLSHVSKSNWEKKLAVYVKWGWSRELAMAAFRKFPNCFAHSVEEIDGKMDLFVNKLGWEPSFVAKNSSVFTYSLRRRLRPRLFVLQFLVSERLLPYGSVSPKLRFFTIVESVFMEKYVLPYTESHNLLELYLEKKSEGLLSIQEEKKVDC